MFLQNLRTNITNITVKDYHVDGNLNCSNVVMILILIYIFEMLHKVSSRIILDQIYITLLKPLQEHKTSTKYHQPAQGNTTVESSCVSIHCGTPVLDCDKPLKALSKVQEPLY